MFQKKAIVINCKDNTATAVSKIDAETQVTVDVDGKESTVLISQMIPFGHKFSLRTIGKGNPVIKYGEVIGYATADIEVGEHVHVHNLESGRGRGDK